MATCCGASVGGSQENPWRDQLIRDMKAQHFLLILCDGMGNSILEQHLASTAFLRRHNQCDQLWAVFPSTTPAALTMLATAQWPGQHGVPGWELREQRECDYPGEAGSSIVQLHILAPRIMNMRNHEPANYASLDDVFIVPPWSRSLHERASSQHDCSKRRIIYCKAGLQSTLCECWQASCKLQGSFLLLTIEEAIDQYLLGFKVCAAQCYSSFSPIRTVLG